MRGATPWFGLRLRAGNSLIGARRAVWTKAQLLAGVHLKSGNEAVEPRQLKPGEMRQSHEVYHYLVFDPDMVPTAGDKLVREFKRSETDQAKNWLKQEVKRRWTEPEVDLALTVSELVDEHDRRYAQERLTALDKTACPASVWPHPPVQGTGPSLAMQEAVKASLESTSGSFQRLKLLMDGWCALFFWPMDEVEALPKREDWLESAQFLLGEWGDQQTEEERLSIKALRLNFDWANLLKAAAGEELNTDLLCAAVPWYRVGRQLTKLELFQHWELTFSEVLGCDASQAKGFDVVVGNPPWIKASWADAPLLCDFDPVLGVREARSAEFNHNRPKLIEEQEQRDTYLNAQLSSLGRVTFMNCHRMYEALRGSQTNLYKNFIVRSWGLLGDSGFGGLLHQEGPYDDANGGRLRSTYYPRLVAHYHFKNEIPIFADVGHQSSFSLNIFNNNPQDINFIHLANLYVPQTISSCRSHHQIAEPIPGIKTDDDQWETKGHRDRIVTVTKDTLQTFHALLEDASVPITEARLPQVHATQLVSVIDKISQSPKWLSSLEGEYYATVMFDETYSQRDGILTRQDNPSFEPADTSEWVVSGPHFFVGTPLNKTPRTRCNSKGAYDDIDLTAIAPNYLPRSVYCPGNKSGDTTKFKEEIPLFDGTLITKNYRHVNRRLASTSTERTLTSAIMPPGIVHINPVLSLTFQSNQDLLGFSTSTFCVISDFLLRAAGRSDIYESTLRVLPKISDPWLTPIMHRGLRLNTLTNHYTDLWSSVALTEMPQDFWASESDILKAAQQAWNEKVAGDETAALAIGQYPYEAPWHVLNPHQWNWHSPLRSDYARRQALLEIDVLVSLALGLTLDELQTIYRVQFPVMRQYELADEYDARGQRIPSTHRKAAGGKEFRAARKDWDGESPLTGSWEIDDGNQTVTKTFYPPFTRCDREADYEYAYGYFKEKYGVKQVD